MSRTITVDTVALLQAGSLVTLLVLLTGGIGLYVLTDPAIEPAYHFFTVAVVIDRQYQRPVDWPDLVGAARRGMIEKLDRYSGFVTEADFAEMRNQRSGSYGGIGASIIEHNRGLLITSVVTGGPASLAGMMDGDVVIRADSVSLAGLSLTDASRFLRGPERSSVRLSVQRPGETDTLTFDLTRRDIPYIHIPYAGIRSDSIGYVRLADFDAGASDAVAETIDSLDLKSGNKAVKGLILDLRGNPGGLYQEAVLTASLFLPEGSFVVGTRGRSRWNSAEDCASGGDQTDDLPLVVMVDGYSASASEITAGALRQAGRAMLVGDTTFGKGLVQGFLHLPGQDGLRLTISRYFLNGGIFLNDFDSTLHEVGRGLAPDVFLEFEMDHEFTRQVEVSLLLQQFVYRHQEELVDDGRDGVLEDSWLDSFAKFADENGFTYQSAVTKGIQELATLAVADDRAAAVRGLCGRMLSLAEADDHQQFTRRGAYLKLRLQQLALQRKYSVYRAYDEVVAPLSPEINLAASLIATNSHDH